MRNLSDVVGSGPLTKPEEIGDRILVLTDGRITTTSYGEAARVNFYFEDDSSKEIKTSLFSSTAIQDKVQQIARQNAFPIRARLEKKFSQGRQQDYFDLTDPDNPEPGTERGAGDDIPF